MRERENEKERERERVRESACVLYYNTKLWAQFYISGLTWEQGWLGSVCASSQYYQTLLLLSFFFFFFFCISSEIDVHT